MKRRNLILLLGGTGSAALGTGTGAFSSASADRSVEVSVVEDENAYVGYAVPEDGQLSATEGDRVTLVVIKNQFPSSDQIGVVDVDFEEEGSDVFQDVTIELISRPDGQDWNENNDEYGDVFDGHNVDYEPLASDLNTIPNQEPIDEKYAFKPGQHVAVRAKFDGEELEETDDNQIDAAVTVHVRGTEGSGVSASIFGDTHTRKFDLTVEEDVDPDAQRVSCVRFKGGNGGVVIETESNDDSGGPSAGDGKVAATAYYELTGGSDDFGQTDKKVETDTKLKLKDFTRDNKEPDSSGRIIGVKVDSIGVFDRKHAEQSGNNGTRKGCVYVSESEPRNESRFGDSNE